MLRSIIVTACFMLCSCSVTVRHGIRLLSRDSTAATVSLPPAHDMSQDLRHDGYRDTATVTDSRPENGSPQSGEYLDADGTVIITEPLDEVVITARSGNIAERNGKVNLAFGIKVPENMLDTRWQIRLAPAAVLNGDTVTLDKIHITGKDYRKRQIRGYELYRRFISGIITDSSMLVYTELLELFISRNIPEIAALKADSSMVEADSITGLYGIRLNEAREHFRKRLAEDRNDRKIKMAGEKYRTLVKDPYVTEGIRIDTVFDGTQPGISYHYTQSMKAGAGLDRIDIVMNGSIYHNGEEIYVMPASPPLTFYISSFSSMAEDIERYLTEIVERKITMSTSASISFRAGRHEIEMDYCGNHAEIEHIRAVMLDLEGNGEYVADSLVITASCSPEGSYRTNRILAARRAESVSHYMKGSSFRLTVRHIPENWERLEELVQTDSCIADINGINAIMKEKNPDKRENMLRNHPEYSHIFGNLYPALREVQFDFHLHRRNMVKDTVHTTVPDTLYSKGVQMLKDRKYKEAIMLLGKYEDINSALAFLSMDYNSSALRVLSRLPVSAKRDYLLAIAHSRTGNEDKASEYFMSAVKQNRAFAFRGNLDPEISRLIDKYNLDPLKN